MRYISSDIIFTITSKPLINNVIVLNTENVIIDIIEKENLPKDIQIEHYPGALCPGFVNTHCHLELSWAKNMLSKNLGLDIFIKELEIAKSKINSTKILELIEKTLIDAYDSGIVAICDISNTDITIPFKNKSDLVFYNFIELYSSDESAAENAINNGIKLLNKFKSSNLYADITPHSPYAVSESLYKKITALNPTLQSIHLLENNDENELFIEGKGKIIERRKFFNSYTESFVPTKKRSLQSIYHLLNPDGQILFVHNTVALPEDIEFAIKNLKKPFWCFCPNSNLFIENNLPNLSYFENCTITIGTDSLASNDEINILSEINTLQKNFSKLDINTALKWATYNGARFINLDNKLGSIEINKQPGIVHLEQFNPDTFKLDGTKSKLIVKANAKNY